jgi:hypothetical protein
MHETYCAQEVLGLADYHVVAFATWNHDIQKIKSAAKKEHKVNSPFTIIKKGVTDQQTYYVKKNFKKHSDIKDLNVSKNSVFG